MWAVIPVKRFELAKQRLAGSLDAPTREALAAAMLEDVLTALAEVPELEGRLIISQEPRVHSLAARHRCLVLEESADSDLCSALEQAARHLEQQSVSAMLVVPGDVPLLRAATIAELVRAHERVTIVPNRERSGTNCLIVTPPRAIPFRFGVDSCNAHAAAAAAAGLPAVVRALPELALDIDSVDDLEELKRRGAGTHSHAVLLACATTCATDCAAASSAAAGTTAVAAGAQQTAHRPRKASSTRQRGVAAHGNEFGRDPA